MAYDADRVAKLFRDKLNDMDSIVSFATISSKKGYRSDASVIACILLSMGFWETKYLRNFK